jgi:2-polyprenyl-3-methyl-5-hydroxy-6-metoxy-1,4-benzoquinol methylase
MEMLPVKKELTGYRWLDLIAGSVLEEWPEHEKFLRLSFGQATDELMRRIDQVAELAAVLMDGQLREFASAYRWMCGQFIEEQFYFARNNKYRLSTLREAKEKIYDNSKYMSRYMKGQLVSEVCWSNHARAMDLFRSRFLPSNASDYDHLEVGPGHGLSLVFAARDSRCRSASGWDLSPSSLEDTRKALERVKVTKEVSLTVRDVVQASGSVDQFDSIICSEVLEHTEEPKRALELMQTSLRPGGRIFLNVPVNSPAPDHIYLWRSSSELREMIIKTGLLIDEFVEIPPTRQSLKSAKKNDIDISCVITAHKAQ